MHIRKEEYPVLECVTQCCILWHCCAGAETLRVLENLEDGYSYMLEAGTYRLEEEGTCCVQKSRFKKACTSHCLFPDLVEKLERIWWCCKERTLLSNVTPQTNLPISRMRSASEIRRTWTIYPPTSRFPTRCANLNTPRPPSRWHADQPLRCVRDCYWLSKIKPFLMLLL